MKKKKKINDEIFAGRLPDLESTPGTVENRALLRKRVLFALATCIFESLVVKQEWKTSFYRGGKSNLKGNERDLERVQCAIWFKKKESERDA